jgi:uncharacterized protein
MLEVLMLTVVGALSGVIAGLVGLAGGIVVVPALTWMYGAEALHTAIVISWFSVLFNSIGAANKQMRMRTPLERRQLLKGARWFLLGAVLITPLVSLWASEAKSFFTKEMVAVLQLCLAAVMLWPISEVAHQRRSTAAMDAGFGGVIGGVSTLIGVGGGTYTIAYFVYGAGARFRDAIATANLTGLTVGVLSVLGYLSSLVLFRHEPAQSTGPISMYGMVAMIVSGVLAAPLGVRLSHQLPTKTLRQILILALMVSAGRLLWT